MALGARVMPAVADVALNVVTVASNVSGVVFPEVI